MIHNDCNRSGKSQSRSNILKSRENSKVGRELKRLRSSGHKVTSPKLKENLNLNCSVRTIQRRLKATNKKYKGIRKKSHKDERLGISKEWLTQSHPWDLTIFSAEKNSI